MRQRDHRAQKLDRLLGQLVTDPYARDTPELAGFLTVDRVVVNQSGEEDSALSIAQEDTMDAGRPFWGGAPTLPQQGTSRRRLVDVERNLYLLMDTFLLLEKGRFSFLRERIVALARTIVKQSFRGKIYELVQSWSDEDNNVGVLAGLLEFALKELWPGGVLFTPVPIPCEEEQAQTRAKALKLLKAALPKSVATLMGQPHCDLVAHNTFEFLQCPRILRGFIMEALAIMCIRLFPDVNPEFRRSV